jgi:hypothetical protein
MGLVALALEEKLRGTTIHLLWRADMPLSISAQRLMDIFSQEATAVGVAG